MKSLFKEKLSIESIGRIEIIIAMTLFGTTGLFAKRISLPSAEIACFRAILALCSMSVVVLLTGRKKYIKHSIPKLHWLFLSGAALAFNWIFFFEAYKYTSVALTTLCEYFAPTLVVAASSIFLKEKLTIKHIICFIASTTGLLMIVGVSGGRKSSDFIGIMFGIGAACFYAINVMINKVTGEIENTVKTAIQFLSAAVVLMPYVSFTCGFSILTIDKTGLISLMILGFINTGITYYFHFSSLSKLRGQQAAILSYIDPLVAVLVSVFVLGESVTLYQLIGGGIILIFAFINEIDFEKIFN